MPALVRAPQVTTGAPVDVGTALANGSGDALALANHVHKMGAGAKTDVLNAKRFVFGEQAIDFTTSAASSDTGNAITKKLLDVSLTKKIAGGTSLSAVVTDASFNRVEMRDSQTHDPLTTPTNQEVFARLTATPTVIAAVFTWDGTTTVLSPDTSEVLVGNFIRLTADGQLFEVSAINTDVDVTILNPGGLTIPTGATASAKVALTTSYKYEDVSDVEQPYTFLATTLVDFVVPEALTLWEAPLNALQTGIAFVEGLSAGHVHDDRYIQKTVLSDKGSLVGASATSTPVDVPVGTNGQVLTAASGQPSGLIWATPSSATWRQEAVTAQNITNTDTALTDLLDNTPVSAASVSLFLNGVHQSQGAGKDYTIASKTITWLASTGTAVDMVSTDEIIVEYQS
jgi:hypothetical protein